MRSNQSLSGRSTRARPAALSRIRTIKNIHSRNIVRGIVTDQLHDEISFDAVNNFRKHSTGHDLAIAAEIVLGSQGAYPTRRVNQKNRDLLILHDLCEIYYEDEIAFISGHLNGWSKEASNIVDELSEFATLPSIEPQDAMEALANFVDRYGASIYASRKVAYLMSLHAEKPNVQSIFDRVSEKVEQTKRSSPYFLSLEILDKDFSYFAGVSTRLQIFQKYIEGDYRRVYALHEIVPVPINDQDAAAHLRRSHSSSLVDEVTSVLTIMALNRCIDSKNDLFSKYMDPILYKKFNQFQFAKFDARSIFKGEPPEHADLTFYRRSYAFVEFENCVKYRYYVDRVLAPRLINGLQSDKFAGGYDINVAQKSILRPMRGFRKIKDYQTTDNCGIFLRTIQFLNLMNCEYVINFDEDTIRSVFSKTQSLDLLLSSAEIELMYATSAANMRPLITVLALALHKAKNHDEDVDFKFRLSFCELIIERYDGKIQNFIDWLLGQSPTIAIYLLYVLDRSTLQRMYWLVNSADEADNIRQVILRTVGKHRGDIDFYIEADAIEARRQVSKLQKYFDDSRIYVDSISFKAWLTKHPSVYAQQYMKIIEHSFDVVNAMTVTIDRGAIVATGITDVSTLINYDYILREAAVIAFEQFCKSKEFGIESYLGRRIRHNTVTNMMRSGIEDLLLQPHYLALRVDRAFKQSNDKWISAFRGLIEQLRKDILQFRSESRPTGFFRAELGEDSHTSNNLATLRNSMIKLRNIELFNEMLIRFCWQQISPQLEEITRNISVDWAKRANDLVETTILHNDSDLHRQYLTEVRGALHERFTRLASWFRQPEDGFVTATPKQLAELLIVEAEGEEQLLNGRIVWNGEALASVMNGLAVHRMYDCLFVVVRNALKYGSRSGPITIEAKHIGPIAAGLGIIEVAVTSNDLNIDSREHHRHRLERSFIAEEVAASMTLEGYSGIGKLRYITQMSEGISTARFSLQHDSVTVAFQLTVEVVDDPEDSSESNLD